MPTGVCRPFFISSYCFGKVMKWKWCMQINNPSWWPQDLWEPIIMIKNSVLSSSLPKGNMRSQEKYTWTQRVLLKFERRWPNF